MRFFILSENYDKFGKFGNFFFIFPKSQFYEIDLFLPHHNRAATIADLAAGGISLSVWWWQGGEGESQKREKEKGVNPSRDFVFRP